MPPTGSRPATTHALVAARASGAQDVRIENGALWLDASPDVIDHLTVTLGRAGVPIRSLGRERRSLEDLFFRLTEEAA